MSTDTPSPPPGLPRRIATQLRTLDDHTLRETISYLGDVLEAHHHQALEQEIEAIPDHELVRVTDHEGYVEVVRGHRCAEGCSECPHGPYLYHVSSVRHPEGEETLQWDLIGPINET